MGLGFNIRCKSRLRLKGHESRYNSEGAPPWQRAFQLPFLGRAFLANLQMELTAAINKEFHDLAMSFMKMARERILAKGMVTLSHHRLKMYEKDDPKMLIAYFPGGDDSGAVGIGEMLRIMSENSDYYKSTVLLAVAAEMRLVVADSVSLLCNQNSNFTVQIEILPG